VARADGSSLMTASPAGNAAGRDEQLPRRRILVGGAATLGMAAAACAVPSSGVGPRLRLTIPAPTGPHRIGTISLHLVDRSRRDPWLAAPRSRELMVSVWYPALDDRRCHRAPWIPPAAGERFLAQLLPSPVIGPSSAGPAPRIPVESIRLPVTTARQWAPADPSARRCPVVLYSPGYEDDRELATGLVSDLASLGYVVVTTDYTYEAAEVVFPGGRIEVGRRPPIAEAVKARLADTRFVLDELAALHAGAGTGTGTARRLLPAGLANALDLSRIGMFGHSLGGATTADAMAADPRILAGIDLDGSIIVSDLPIPGDQVALLRVRRLAGAVAKKLGNRPFMIMTHAGHGPRDDVTIQAFWANLSGWRRLLALDDSGHYSYTDDEEFLSQLASSKIIPPGLASQVVVPAIGTIDPARAISAERTYLAAFFDQHLRHRHRALLDRPSPLYPEIQFIAT